MIARWIDWCSRNRFLVFTGVFLLVLAGIWSMGHIPLDALPDISDVQVIIHTSWPGEPPNIIEDQVTYPIVTALLTAPQVKEVRAQTMFGDSYVYVIFQDGTDIYWARSRVLEYLQQIKGRIPPGVNPEIGPDATGAGWVYEYVLVDHTHKYSLADLRTLQDWYIRYWLETVPGVSEVATIGGFVRQFQVNLDPNKLLAYNIPLRTVIDRVRESTNEVGGRLLEFGGAEYMVRGLGYFKSLDDLRNVPVGVYNGTPILVSDLGTVTYGPDIRRGVADWNGEGETVGGIVVMRYGQNALNVIHGIKAKIAEMQASLPPSVEIVPAYDRAGLIHESINTLQRDLLEESLIVSLVIILFLFHFRSALIPILTLPIAVIASFIPMYYFHVTANIMSLGGIALAIGVLVDAAIVMVENGYRCLSEAQAAASPPTGKGAVDPPSGPDLASADPPPSLADPPVAEDDPAGSSVATLEAQPPTPAAPPPISNRERQRILLGAAKQVGAPIFFSLIIIIVSFLPVFLLQAQEGRLFRPLAWTKTLAIGFSSLLSITLIPILMILFIRGHLKPESANPVSRFTQWLYLPVLRFCLRHRLATLLAGLAFLAATIPLAARIGSQFMPPFYEGSALYMPTSYPGISITQASDLMQEQDRIIRSFPEVKSVFGTVGRSDSATDNADLSMFDTAVVLKPREQWPRGMTYDKLIHAMNAKLQFPGITNDWTAPIQSRLDMELTGIKTPVGMKIQAPNLADIQQVGAQVQHLLSGLPGVRSVFAERVLQGFYVNVAVNRAVAARYGLTVADVQRAVTSGIGGEDVATNIEGRERYPINVRYSRDFRDNIPALERVLIPTPSGAQIPVSEVASITFSRGPALIRDEDAQLTGYVYFDLSTSDYGGFVQKATNLLRQKLQLPPGASYHWSGEYEFEVRAQKRLELIMPIVFFVIFVLLYMTFNSATEAAILILPTAFALTGGLLLQWLLGYNFSVAVWVGYIALFGIAVETGVVMVVYLHEALDRRLASDVPVQHEEIEAATIEGAVQRLRPKLMTVFAVLFSLGPILWETGVGSDVMKPIATPMVGGMVTSTIGVLLLVPVLFSMLKERQLRRGTLVQSGAKADVD